MNILPLPPRIRINNGSNEKNPKTHHNLQSQLIPPKIKPVPRDARRVELEKPKVPPHSKNSHAIKESFRITTPDRESTSESSDEHDDYPKIVPSNPSGLSDETQDEYVEPMVPIDQVSG